MFEHFVWQPRWLLRLQCSCQVFARLVRKWLVEIDPQLDYGLHHAPGLVVLESGIAVAEGRTIQEVVNAASPGDTVVVLQAEHNQRVTLQSGVSLCSEGCDPSLTVLEGSCEVKSGCTARVTGMGLRGGVEVDGVGSKLALERCSVTGSQGDGVVVTNQGEVSVADCEVARNAGAGVSVVGNGSRATVEMCEIAGNQGSAVAFAGAFVDLIAVDDDYAKDPDEDRPPPLPVAPPGMIDAVLIA